MSLPDSANSPVAPPPSLALIGWNAHCALALSALEQPEGRPARVVAQHRAHFALHDGEQELKALPIPKLHEQLTAAGDGLSVGDWVLVEEHGNTLFIMQRLARHTMLARSRGDGSLHRIVANADIALLVMGLDGDYSPNRLERYLLLARGAGVLPVVVLTKPDCCDEVEGRTQEIRTLAGTATPVHVLDARTDEALTVLAPYLDVGRTLVLLGSSGVGKSSLTNTLLGGDAQRTQATREHDDRGRHTTTARTLHRLPQGACLIDTPGVRELRLSGDEAVQADSFDDVRQLAARCRFSDCRHQKEPGCAVVAGVPADRLAHYHKLTQELAALQQTRLLATGNQRGGTKPPNTPPKRR